MHFSVADFLSDVVENSIEAKAGIIVVDVVKKDRLLHVFVADNGSGMDGETLKRAVDPFYTGQDKHPSRKVGLGLPFLKQAATQAGGNFEIDSDKEMGTSVHFSFDTANVDAPPLGDITGAFVSLMSFDGGYELVINFKDGSKHYSVKRSALTHSLGELNSAVSLRLMKEYLVSLEQTN
jgi:hypothetical protein